MGTTSVSLVLTVITVVAPLNVSQGSLVVLVRSNGPLSSMEIG